MNERSGIVSYRLERQRVIDGVRAGYRDRLEVCDAQPELRRVANNHATAMNEPCPICEGDQLVAVSFAFGPGLPRSGRCITDVAEMQRLRARHRSTIGFRVEVCRSCWWNHLRESFPIAEGSRSRLLG
ncbi:MAG: DUF5318 family protein [Acidimicrobiales bacterium]|nr:DUF5318 family protein [Acidimicrobiales bacterium]